MDYLHPQEGTIWTTKSYDFLPNYRIKHAIVDILKPARIFEIGVRAGYSAAAFISTGWVKEYVGLDLNLPFKNGISKVYDAPLHAQKTLRERFPETSIDVHIGDSRDENVKNMLRNSYKGYFDFIHVDGNHYYNGCKNDLYFALELIKKDGVILVDDYTYEKGVEGACAMILQTNPGYQGEFIPSYRGEFILSKKK